MINAYDKSINMVKRRVTARDSKSALKKARRKYPSLSVTKVNWLKDVRTRKAGMKTYEVVAHKKKK